ncbi:preprotein translocase subunit SecG [Salinimicrobium terrae]|uniref:preprotein translocase subunit SecG n=1 Tax=Salinimicrobium terrae TaxID=470866 RepID=UPI00049169FC|nr:preprotein translocase subunit SecG [Salinimicrobium terrae]
MSTFTIFLTLIIIVAFLLVVVIMVQNPKGGGLSSSFGGGANQIGGVQKTSDFLDKSTWTLATLLLVLILLSNVTIMDNTGVGESRIMGSDPEVETNIPAPIEPPVTSPGEQN